MLTTEKFRSQIMLVLSRRIGEEIIIDDTMRVVVLGVQNGRIRLGLSAPPHISIQRSEVRDRIAADNSVAGDTSLRAYREIRAATV